MSTHVVFPKVVIFPWFERCTHVMKLQYVGWGRCGVSQAARGARGRRGRRVVVGHGRGRTIGTLRHLRRHVHDQ